MPREEFAFYYMNGIVTIRCRKTNYRLHGKDTLFLILFPIQHIQLASWNLDIYVKKNVDCYYGISSSVRAGNMHIVNTFIASNIQNTNVCAYVSGIPLTGASVSPVARVHDPRIFTRIYAPAHTWELTNTLMLHCSRKLL